MKRKKRLRFRLGSALPLLPLTHGCSGDTAVIDPGPKEFACSIPQKDLLKGGPGKDGIPALTNHTFVSVGDIETAYLQPEDRVVGLDLPLSLRFGTKLPGNEFPVDATVLPLTEGRRDWEVSIESGFQLPDPSTYFMGWIGYR